MSFTIKGQITSISEIRNAGQGFSLEYEIDSKEQYNNLYKFDYYNKEKKYLDKFLEDNKLGDEVEVEFNVRLAKGQSKATGKDYAITSLSHWECTKVNDSSTSQSDTSQDEGDLPF